MMNKSLKRVLSLMCTLALLLGMVVMPNSVAYAADEETQMPSESTETGDNEITGDELAEAEEVEATYREVTFSDFGIKDYIIPGGTQVTNALSDADNLDGVAFTGYVQLQLQADMRYSLRLGGKYDDTPTDDERWAGVGMWPEATTHISFYYYKKVVGGGSAIAQLPIADYGIAYDAATNTYSEFKLRVTFDYIEDTSDVRITISLNDILAVDQVLTDAQNYFGNHLNVWTDGGKTMAVKSVEDETASYNEVTYADFGILDQKIPSSSIQRTGAMSGAENLDGVAFTGMVQMGVITHDVQHSLRIGGKDGSDATLWSGLGLRTAIDGYGVKTLRIAYYTGVNNYTDIATLSPAEYGITYDADTGSFSAVKLRVTFDYIADTADVQIKVYINDFMAYSGTLSGAQNVLGNRLHVWAKTMPISVASVFAKEEASKSYYEVTFSDCGLSDQIIANGGQPRGEVPGVDTLDGVAFTGKLQMGLGGNIRAHSFRIGCSDSGPYSGLGIATVSATELNLCMYTGDVARSELVRIPIADYGVTYDTTTGLYSEFKYRVTFDYIDDSTDVMVQVFINDKQVCKGILLGAQDTLGNQLWLWCNGNTIQITSVDVPVTYNEVTFSDFGILDQTIPSGGIQRTGVLSGAETLDGVAFTGTVQMSTVQHALHSFRIGGKDGTSDTMWSGVGMRTEGTSKLLFCLYTGVSAYSELATVPIADYGILYDSDSGSYSAFKLRVTFQNIGAANVMITISVNGILAYSGILSDGQTLLGNRLHVWTQGGSISVASVTDGEEESATYREVTFSDFGVSDQVVTGQIAGALTDAANLDGVAFTGKLQMGLGANIYHSFRIGGKDGDVDANWSGLGLRTASASTLALQYYTAHNGGKGELATIAIADYGITYDADTGLFSELTLRTTFDHIDGTNDIYTSVYINDKLVCKGILLDAQDYFGNQLRVWANGSTIDIKSAVDKAADDILDISGISVTLHDAISMNFYIAPQEIGNSEMRVIIGSDAPTALASAGTDAEGNYIYVVELAAAQLTDTVTLQLVSDGAAGNSYTTTGRDYAEAVLADASYSACHTLVKQVLNYGAAAQVYFDHNATDLANKNYPVDTAEVPEDVPTVTVSDNTDAINFYGATLLFESRTAVRFYFVGSSEGIADATDLGNGMFYIEKASINPQNLDEEIELVVTDASGNTLTVNYSPMHYIKRMYNRNSSENLKAVLKALYNYNLSANDYVDTQKKNIASLVDFVVEAEEGREFRILQITDTQIIDPGQKRYAGRIEESEPLTDEQLYADCFYYIEEAVKQAQPDLILLTGDIVYGEFDDNGTSLQKLVAYMESLDILWAPIFGNHENESIMGVTWQCQQFEQAENCLFKRGDLTGNSNYTIGIQQGDKLIKVIYMMDTNGCWNGKSYSYMPEFGEYNQDEKLQTTPGIGTDVIEWVDETSTQITEALGYTPAKFAAFHIPITEFTAATIAKGYRTSDEATSFVINDPTGEDFGTQNSESVRIATSNLWSIMKRQNFDGVFVGHEHTNNTSIVFDGIRLTFGLKTGVYDSHMEDMLGGTLITVAEGGVSFDVEHCYVEPME